MIRSSFCSRLGSWMLGACVVLSSGLLRPATAAAQSAGTVRAYAEFLINPTGCRETYVEVAVTDTPAGTRVDFTYYVLSTCPDGDFLYYHFITGGDFLDSRDFQMFGKSQAAVLSTLVPAFDDEGGTEFEMGLEVLWIATGKERNGTRPAIAAVRVLEPFGSPYITEIIFPSIHAELSRPRK